MRPEGWPSWLIGLVFGAAAGLVILLGGAPARDLGTGAFLGLAFLVLLALAFVAARNLAFLSGAFAGLGGTWLALTVRAQLACDAFNADPIQGCTGYGVGPFLGVSAGMLVVGVLLGLGAWRRRAGQARSQTGS